MPHELVVTFELVALDSDDGSAFGNADQEIATLARSSGRQVPGNPQLSPIFSHPYRIPSNTLASEDNCLYTSYVKFEWDLPKARANLRVHGVSFAEAATVREDDFALTRRDPDVVDEPRFVTLGLSDLGKLLVVVYTWREPGTIPLISAWKANRRQRMQYEKDHC